MDEKILEILINRRDDAMYNLECCVKSGIKENLAHELAYLHSRFSFDVYNYKIMNKHIRLDKIIGDYRR